MINNDMVPFDKRESGFLTLSRIWNHAHNDKMYVLLQDGNTKI